jgi:hypothetical protein
MSGATGGCLSGATVGNKTAGWLEWIVPGIGEISAAGAGFDGCYIGVLMFMGTYRIIR